LFSNFTPPADVPLVLENNVNCAAIAEQSHGVARGRADFAYIQVGVKVGMGIVLRGQLLRGQNGAAGEISHIAFPFALDRQPQDPVALEDYLGADALMQRVRADWPAAEGAPPGDAPQLLAFAEAGHRAAVAAVARHGLDIGAMVATSVSIIDPGLVVLGGGIGNSAQILPHVRSVVERLTFPTEIVSSALGPDATVLGIEQLAAEHACQQMIGEPAGL
jgi:predicted NBD/HSP70 family sugar kinase